MQRIFDENGFVVNMSIEMKKNRSRAI